MVNEAVVLNNEIGTKKFERFFLNENEESIGLYLQAMQHAEKTLVNQFAVNKKPYSGLTLQELKANFNQTFREVIPEEPTNLRQLINEIGETILKHAIVVTHPSCAAHLHCPPLSAALAAEVMISGANQSMDSWDQSTSATVLEQMMVNWLTQVFLKNDTADGVFTSGGTQSNFMGLLLARERYLSNNFNWNAQKQGLPMEAHKLRIFCSQEAHFTVRQSAFLLGLGEQAVISVETDNQHRMCVVDLDKKIREAKEQNLLPFALVGTAGTTDFGSIDPLEELAKRAEEHQMWLHIDAAYGGALMLSNHHRRKLNGIHLGDSITVDFHKLFYQPISCGAFLIKDKSNFNFIKLNADYLNPEEDEATGIPNLVTKSIQTTRRFDSLKLFMSLNSIGRKLFAEMIDYTIDLTKETALYIKEDPKLELINEPEINAVVFRYINYQNNEKQLNRVNTYIRSQLLEKGSAVLARTRVNQSVYLKLTLLNPRTTMNEVKLILKEVTKIGEEFNI